MERNTKLAILAVVAVAVIAGAAFAVAQGVHEMDEKNKVVEMLELQGLGSDPDSGVFTLTFVMTFADDAQITQATFRGGPHLDIYDVRTGASYAKNADVYTQTVDVKPGETAWLKVSYNFEGGPIDVKDVGKMLELPTKGHAVMDISSDWKRYFCDDVRLISDFKSVTFAE